MYMVGHTVRISVAFDGKFEIGFVVQAGKRKWTEFFIPSFFIDGYICGLPGCEDVTSRIAER